MWTEIDGRQMSVDEFQWHIQNLVFGKWHPIGIVWHNTASPTLVQWKQHPREQWLKNLASYYKGLGWHAGPHLFIDHEKINLFTPLSEPGVHSPSFNAQYIGIEHVGDFGSEDPNSGDGLLVKQNGIAATAILCAKLGIPVDVRHIKIHKEDPRTTHDCPGKHLADEKDQNVQAVLEYMAMGGEHSPVRAIDPHTSVPAPVPPGPMLHGTVQIEGLNLRSTSSMSGTVLAQLSKGRPVDIYGTAQNGGTRWLHIKLPDKLLEGWVAAQYIEPIP